MRALNDKVGAVDLGLLIPAILIENESCLQNYPFGAADLTNAPFTVMILLPLATVKEDDRSAIPSVEEFSSVIAGSSSERSSGSSISTTDPLIIG